MKKKRKLLSCMMLTSVITMSLCACGNKDKIPEKIVDETTSKVFHVENGKVKVYLPVRVTAVTSDGQSYELCQVKYDNEGKIVEYTGLEGSTAAEKCYDMKKQAESKISANYYYDDSKNRLERIESTITEAEIDYDD